MPAVGRRKGQARRIVPPAETEVDAGIKQLPGKGRPAAETVDFDGKYMRHDIGRRALAAMEG